MSTTYFLGWSQPFHMAFPDIYRHSKPGDGLPPVPSVREHVLSCVETDDGFVAKLANSGETKSYHTASEAMAAGHKAMIDLGWTLDSSAARFAAAIACAEHYRPAAKSPASGRSE